MKFLYGIGITAVILAIVGALYHDQQRDEYRQSCDARGGRALFLENDRVCLDKGTLR